MVLRQLNLYSKRGEEGRGGENQEGYLGGRGPPEKGGVPAPYRDPQPRVPVTRKGVPTTSGCENQEGLCLEEMEGYWKPRHPFTGPAHRLTDTHSKLQRWKCTRHYGEKPNCMASRRVLEGQPPLFLCGALLSHRL